MQVQHSPALGKTHKPTPDGLAHRASLDGLRFFAFMGVFLYHATQYSDRLNDWFHVGHFGRQVFFVLSGFLIGGIIFAHPVEPGFSLWDRLKTFYVRRALRIFPLYYLLLLLIAILPLFGLWYMGTRALLPWHAAFLSNVGTFRYGDWPGPQSHLWSLSVEEHFYLISARCCS